MFTEVAIEVHPLDVAGDHACVEWVASAVHSGPLPLATRTRGGDRGDRCAGVLSRGERGRVDGDKISASATLGRRRGPLRRAGASPRRLNKSRSGAQPVKVQLLFVLDWHAWLGHGNGAEMPAGCGRAEWAAADDPRILPGAATNPAGTPGSFGRCSLIRVEAPRSRVPAGLRRRPAGIERIAGSECRIVSAAPAGYGKTTLRPSGPTSTTDRSDG